MDIIEVRITNVEVRIKTVQTDIKEKTKCNPKALGLNLKKEENCSYILIIGIKCEDFMKKKYNSYEIWILTEKNQVFN